MLTKKTKYIKVPTLGIVFFSILLAAVSFFSGMSWYKLKANTNPVSASVKSANTFNTEKSDKPELKFFVMSFCPYGNQIEDVLRPVYDLLKDKANLTPHYIFDKVTDLPTTCKNQSGDPNQCQVYLDSIAKSGNTTAPFKTLAECKTYINDSLNKCLDDKNYLKTSNGNLYTSLHGRIEANQNVREMCAWNQVSDKKIWWDFVGNVNKNCTAQNADTCWEQQAKSVGLDTNKITECFNKDAVNLIEQEIALTTQYKVQGSPTVLVNNTLFPPESAYTQDGKGSINIGDKTATQDKYRTPNVVKEVLCSSFNKSPKECATVLNELSGVAPAAGGCN